MAYTPSAHDPLCTCERDVDLSGVTLADLMWMLGNLRRKRYAGLPFTQTEVDAWN